MDLRYVDEFLYHGIRNPHSLEKLESIFKSRMIKSGKNIDGYMNYSDNCNKGEFVSLLRFSNEIGFDVFINENISLIIRDDISYIETTYLPFHEWEKKKDDGYFSYLNGELLSKDIPFSMVVGIGLPYSKLKGMNVDAETIYKDITSLMEKYNITLPIVDTSRYNVSINKIKKLSGI